MLMKNFPRRNKKAQEFFQLSKDYFTAYKAVENQWPDVITNTRIHLPLGKVKWYLLGISLELGLKAFFVGNGLNIKELKALGHNLSDSHKKAQQMRLFESMKPVDRGRLIAQLRIFDKNYNTHYFKYPNIDNQSPDKYCDPITFSLTVNAVLDAVEKKII